ncbi:hypothetical protein Noda2021_09590 [Candidatus Dependentiae bacterium Noda2021]|nr:hypothetical protein Noda2021_09590 [Candidatus Dependentiae bacterium Noda2021]
MIFSKKRSVVLSSLLIITFVTSTQLFPMAVVLTQLMLRITPALEYLVAIIGGTSQQRSDSAALQTLHQHINPTPAAVVEQLPTVALDVSIAIASNDSQAAQSVAASDTLLHPSNPLVLPTLAKDDLIRPGFVTQKTAYQLATFSKSLAATIQPGIKVIPREQGFLALLLQQAHVANKYKSHSLWNTNNAVPGITRYQHASGLFGQIEAKAPQHSLAHRVYYQQVQSANRHFALVKKSQEYVLHVQSRLNHVLNLVVKLASPNKIERLSAYFELNALRETWWVQTKIDPLLQEINKLVTTAHHELASVEFDQILRPIITNYLKDVGCKDIDGLINSLNIPAASETLTSRIFKVGRSFTRWYPNQDKVFANAVNQQLIALIDACERYDVTQAQHIMQGLSGNHIAEQVHKEFTDHYKSLLYTKEGIYKLYEHDPIWQQLSHEQKTEITSDAEKLAQLNQNLALRYIIKENIFKAWNIPQTVSSYVHQTVYKLVDNPQLLTSPVNLSNFLSQEVLSIPAHEYESWMKTFFFKNGLVVDFVNWPEAGQYGMPLAIHELEHVALRNSFNNALYLIHSNHAQAPAAKNIICYIQRALTTQDAHLAQSYKTLISSLEKSIANRSPLLSIIPDYSKHYSNKFAIQLQNLLVKMTAKLLDSHNAAVLARGAYNTLQEITKALNSLQSLVTTGTTDSTQIQKLEEFINTAPYEAQDKAEFLSELHHIKESQAKAVDLGQECGADMPEVLPQPGTLPWADPERRPLSGGHGGLGEIEDRLPEWNGPNSPGLLPEIPQHEPAAAPPVPEHKPEPCNTSKGVGRLPSVGKAIVTNNNQTPPHDGDTDRSSDSETTAGGLPDTHVRPEQEAEEEVKSHDLSEVKGSSVSGTEAEAQPQSEAHTQTASQAQAKAGVIDPATEAELAEWRASKQKLVENLKKAIDILKKKYGADSESFKKMLFGIRELIQKINNGVDCDFHPTKVNKAKVHIQTPKEFEKYIPSTQEIQQLNKLLDEILLSIEEHGITELEVKLKHILTPEIVVDCKKGTVGISGWHYDFLRALAKSGLIEIHAIVEYPDGTYKLTWSYLGSRTKDSTFFPAHWTAEQVTKAIKEALENVQKIRLDNNQYEIVGKTINGMKIVLTGRIVKNPFTKSNILKIVSAYPDNRI